MFWSRWLNPGPAWPEPDFGNLGTWKSRSLESKKSQKIEILKIKICSPQNVDKVWISREKTFPAPFGAIPGNFFPWTEKIRNVDKAWIYRKQKKTSCHFMQFPHGPKHNLKKCKQNIPIFHWWANGPMLFASSLHWTYERALKCTDLSCPQ